MHYSSDLSREEFERRCRRQPFWYHSYYFDNGFEVRGDYNIGPDIASYGFPDDLAGATVLDIGTGAGWFAHYFHQRGAVVTAVDVRGPMDYDAFGVFERPGGMGARPPDRLDADGQPIYFSPSSGAFWLMRDLLGADIGFKNARATDVCPDLFGGQRFDLVFLGALLCHVRDPIGALMAARSVCAGQVVASTLVDVWDTSSDAAARLMWTQPSAVGWWFPNLACYREWFLAAGFRDPDVSRQVSLRADRPRESASRTQLHVAGHAFV
ncbi:MAG TPA: methyltransferase domain-containing protein [Acidimicrobiia bacterium]|nr:methyltransferase domain-containing protein [Acidimicrobiia bacterium]